MIDRIAYPWGERTPFGRDKDWPVRVGTYLEDGVSEDDVDAWVQMASILHSNGDAFDVAVKDGRMVGCAGAPADFNTRADACETYGHDLLTGAANEEDDHRALAPNGRAFLKATGYVPPHEEPSEEYPFRFTTGRTIYQFHTRTKTARAPQLDAAAPEAWIELCPSDAESLGIGEGDVFRVESPRGAMEARARVSGIREGEVFAPFHYGYFDAKGKDAPGDGTKPRAANELTITDWDPVSKQPLLKLAAVRVTKVADGGGEASPAPTIGAPAPADGANGPAPRPTSGGRAAGVTETIGG